MHKKILTAIAVCTLFLIIKCGTDTQQTNTNQTAVTKKDTVDNGIGQFKEVKLTHPLDEGMVGKGEGIYKAKCIACHKLTTEKLVGPGWKGVTDRRTPEWIMNFITNTNVMLDSDLVAQQLMVVCVARMPNQNVSNEDARFVLEFIRKNDGKN
jgi:mono/diheme cytochrome c family protein